MELTEIDVIKIKKLIKSCEEMIDGKFILADSKVSSILHCIIDSEVVYGRMSELMKNFNYDKEFARAKIKSPTKPSQFLLSEDPQKLLPMVFCLLVDIENKKINLHNFVSEYFSTENGKEYESFTEKVILSFKNAIEQAFLSNYVVAEKTENKSNNKQEAEQNLKEYSEELDIFQKISKIANEIYLCLVNDTKIKQEEKQNGVIIVKAMLRACQVQDFIFLNGLIVGFEIFSKNIKSIKYIYQELKETLTEYYSQIKE